MRAYRAVEEDDEVVAPFSLTTGVLSIIELSDKYCDNTS